MAPFESGNPIDLITLRIAGTPGQLDSVGGLLIQSCQKIRQCGEHRAYADIVRERAVVREMISVANKIAEAGFDPQGRTGLLTLLNPSLRLPKVVQTKDEGRTSPMCSTQP